MANPAPSKKLPSDPKAAIWSAVIGKVRKHLSAPALARIEARAAGVWPSTGDPVLDLGDSLIDAIVSLEKAIAQKRMAPQAATAKQMVLASMLAGLGLTAPAPAKVAPPKE